MAYDSPHTVISREINLPTQTGVASATITKLLQFQKATLKRVHAAVIVAGTNAAAGFDIYVGTSSVGAVTLGTNTAGSLANSGTLNVAVPANSILELRGKANSATMQFTPVLELRVDDDAVPTT
jgi:hypothetical protein